MKKLNFKNKLLFIMILQFISIQTVFSQLNDQLLFPKNKIFNSNFKIEDFNYWYQEMANDNLFSFKIENETLDDLGYKHIKINQYYNEIKIENAVYILHSKNDKILSANGYLYKIKPAKSETLLSERKIVKALKSKRILIDKDNFNITSLTKKYIQNKDSNLVLCYEIPIKEIDKNETIYVNSQSVEIERTIYLNNHISVLTEVETNYSGKQKIQTDFSKGVYTLLDSTRGKGIETLSLENSKDTSNFKQIADSSNTWSKFKNSIDKSVLDVHFGATATYDYFLKVHNRNSLDNKGYKLRNLVHYGQNFVNAYWDGSKMIFGDGDSKIGPLVSLDIIGHEITHGLTSHTAKLLLENESGALNESFSDIFGVVIDFYTRPDKANWTVAEEVSPLIRSLEDPSINNDPDTYLGVNWKPIGGADFGGIHSNNGVQNHWFYRLVNGGSGINDLKDTFKVEGIGIDKAAQIVYRNLVYYLTPQSNFNDARIGSIQAATDLFGSCSKEVEAVSNAWYAVGVGEKYYSKIKSDFEVSYTEGCDSLTIKLINKTQNGKRYNWIFGDGTISTEFEPLHTYTKAGVFSITLISTGDTVCGIKDSITKINLINITKSSLNEINLTHIDCSLPSVFKPNIPLDSLSTLSWYNNQKKLLDIGNSFIFKNIEDSVVYFEKNHYKIGNTSSNLSTAFYNFNVRHLIFDVYHPLIIESVEVNASSTGNRIFELRDKLGKILISKTINIPAGVSRVELNFKVDPGNDYQIGIGGNLIGLSRSNTGVKYPYKIDNLISIKRSNAQNAGYDFYYFFYNWDVKKLISPSEKYIAKIKIIKPKLDTIKIQLENKEFKTNIDSSKVNIQWYDCDLKTKIQNENKTIFKPTKDGNYTTILNEKNCILSDTLPCLNYSTLSMNLINDISFELYPNPFTDKLNIHTTNNNTNLSIEVKGPDGKCVIRKSLATETIDASTLLPGIYFITIYDSEQKIIHSNKMIKL